MSKTELKLVERDYEILKLIYRFRFCLGRHIKVLSSFSSARATDRRLKKLLEAGYIERTKYIYGIPYMYTLTHKGRMLLGVNKRAETIRIDRIVHDIHVLDVACYYFLKEHISINNIITEKEMNSKDGFGTRRHYPDMIIIKENQTYAVEIETALKSKERLFKNIKDNYLTYDYQVWFISDTIPKLHRLMIEAQNTYSNITIKILSEVLRELK